MEEQGSSFREELEKQYNDALEETSTETVETEGAQVETVSQDSRSRDESGRFAPKQKEIQETQATQTGDQTPQVVEQLNAPAGWSDDAKSRFKTYPAEVQKALSEDYKLMQTDYIRKTQEVAGLRRRYDEIDQILDPVRDDLRLSGLSEGQFVGQMLAWQRKLDSDPISGIAHLAATYGLSIQQLAQHATQNRGAQVDPERLQLRQELEEARRWREEQSEQTQVAQFQTLVNQVDGWGNAVGSDGKRIRPLYEDVAPAMQTIIGSLREQPQFANAPLETLLDAAYQEAARPFQKYLEQTKQQETAAQIQKARQARAAGSGISGSIPAPTSAPAKSFREELERQYNLAQG